MKLKTAAPHREAQEGSQLPLVLILCTANSCRSQMAEGFLKAAAADFLEVASAGSKPSGFVHPLAIQVMAELGINISEHRSKSIAEFLARQVETVITVCSDADEACPVFPGHLNRYHWPFNDPAKAEGSTEEKLRAFREVRDQMRSVFEAYAVGRKPDFSGKRDPHKQSEPLATAFAPSQNEPCRGDMIVAQGKRRSRATLGKTNNK